MTVNNTPLPAPVYWFSRLNFSIASIILLFSFVVYVAYAVNLMSFPFDYDQGEGFELVDTIMFSQFEFPFQDTESFPFYSSNYPPVYHIIAAPFVWIFGEAYWYGRLLSFLSTIVTATAIYYAIFRETKTRWIAVLSGLAFLASNTVYHIGPLFRQHISMVMFETLAVVILVRAFPARDKRGIALSFFLLILAGYTKQLAAFTAIAVLLWMLLRNPRRAIVWGTGFAVAGLAVFAWLYLATNGEWWRQAIVANVNQYNPLQAFGLFRLWFGLHGFLIIPAVLMIMWELYRDRLSAYSLWFIVTAILGGIGSSAWGAGDSYFATTIAATCVLAGLFLGKVARGDFGVTTVRYAGVIIIPLLFVGYGIATLKMPTDQPFFREIAQIFNIQPNVTDSFYDSATWEAGGYARIGYFITQEDIDAGYEIVARMNELPADVPVLSEEAGFSIVAGREVITNPTQLLNLSRTNNFDGSAFISMIEEQAFGLIIMRAQFYPTSVLVAISENYTRDEVIRMNGFDYALLRPIAR